MSKKIVLAADGLTATVADAVLGDIPGALLSHTTFLSGTYGMIVTGLKVVGGMSIEANARSGSFKPKYLGGQ